MSGSYSHIPSHLDIELGVDPISGVPLINGSKDGVGDQGLQFYGGLVAASYCTVTGRPLVEHTSGIEYKDPVRAEFNRELEACLKDEKVRKSEEATHQVKLMMGQNDFQSWANQPMPASTVPLFIAQVKAHAELDAKDPSGKASAHAHAEIDEHYHPKLSKEFAKEEYTSGEILHSIGYANARRQAVQSRLTSSAPVSVTPPTPVPEVKQTLKEQLKAAKKAVDDSRPLFPGLAFFYNRQGLEEYRKARSELDKVAKEVVSSSSADKDDKEEAEKIIHPPVRQDSSGSSSDSDSPSSYRSPQAAKDELGSNIVQVLGQINESLSNSSLNQDAGEAIQDMLDGSSIHYGPGG